MWLEFPNTDMSFSSFYVIYFKVLPNNPVKQIAPAEP